jgi:anti-sigma regulatory factor (Ser/Thr protein kinase)
MTKPIEFVLANRPLEIASLQDQLEAYGRQHRIAPRVLHDVQLALEEHLTNVISYAFRNDQEHQINVRIQIRESELAVEVEDDGRAFNPLEQKPIGGLGVYIMRQSLDSLQNRREQDRNRVVMIKRIQGQPRATGLERGQHRTKQDG